jgi:hypothetical protein
VTVKRLLAAQLRLYQIKNPASRGFLILLFITTNHRHYPG